MTPLVKNARKEDCACLVKGVFLVYVTNHRHFRVLNPDGMHLVIIEMLRRYLRCLRSLSALGRDDPSTGRPTPWDVEHDCMIV